MAEELINSASRALRRGGVAAAAAFWERAVALTPDPGERASRALTAAEAKYAAGDFEAAQTLLLTAELGPPGELGRPSGRRGTRGDRGCRRTSGAGGLSAQIKTRSTYIRFEGYLVDGILYLERRRSVTGEILRIDAGQVAGSHIAGC